MSKHWDALKINPDVKDVIGDYPQITTRTESKRLVWSQFGEVLDTVDASRVHWYQVHQVILDTQVA